MIDKSNPKKNLMSMTYLLMWENYGNDRKQFDTIRGSISCSLTVKRSEVYSCNR